VAQCTGARAAAAEIAKTSLQHYSQLFDLQPHRTESCKRANDPFFIQ
jgi:putative transposase